VTQLCPNDLPLKIAARITIDPGSGCWIAGPPYDKDGYARYGGQGLHRVVYRLMIGPIGVGLVIDHVKARGCISLACCNPAHMRAVTSRINTLRRRSFAAVNYRKTACGTCGTAYDLFNTYYANGAETVAPASARGSPSTSARSAVSVSWLGALTFGGRRDGHRRRRRPPVLC
jgi:hypothetical protein